MASIKGIQLKQFQQMETRRGIAYTGTFVMEEQKVGSFENNGDGGMTSVWIEPPYQTSFQERLADYFGAKEVDEEAFVEALISLHEAEEVYKQQGKPILLETYSYDDDTPYEELTWDTLGPVFYTPPSEKALEMLIKELKPKKYHVYRSLEDFQRE